MNLNLTKVVVECFCREFDTFTLLLLLQDLLCYRRRRRRRRNKAGGQPAPDAVQPTAVLHEDAHIFGAAWAFEIGFSAAPRVGRPYVKERLAAVTRQTQGMEVLAAVGVGQAHP